MSGLIFCGFENYHRSGGNFRTKSFNFRLLKIVIYCIILIAKQNWIFLCQIVELF